MTIDAKVPEPNDEDSQFAGIVAANFGDLDATAPAEIDEFAQNLRVQPAVQPVQSSAAPTAPAANIETPQAPAAPAAAKPDFAVAVAPPHLVRPERPVLTEPKRPAKPNLGRVEDTGHRASVAGYVLAVGVGGFGQIMFFATWLAATGIESPWNWVAAVIGAAFAEIGMIGAGNNSLTKRRDGGRWKLLLSVACFVCFAAVSMQVAHWLPISFGIALVFGLASFVGFLIHMVTEHSKIRDYEDRVARYEIAYAEYQAELQARYEADVAEYETALAREQRQAAAARREQDRQQTAPEKIAHVPAPAKPKAQPLTKAASADAGGADIDQATAIRLGLDRKATTPMELAAVLTEEGHGVPSRSTLKRWTKQIRVQLAQEQDA